MSFLDLELLVYPGSMKILSCMVAVLTIQLGHAFGQTAVELDAPHFLATDIKKLTLSRASFAEAVEQLRKVASSSEFTAPEVRVVSYSKPQNSEDFPFREDEEIVVSVRLSDVSVHEALESLCFACGYALDLKYGQIRCFEIPHFAPNPHVFLVESSTTSRDADLRSIALPWFKADRMPFLDALEFLRSTAVKASVKRILPFAVVEYRPRSNDRGESHDIAERIVSLDVEKIPFVDCLRYVAELGGCSHRMSPGGAVTVNDIHTLYHPRYTRVVMLKDFARVMKVELSVLTEKSITDWMSQKAGVEALPVIHSSSGRVYLDYLLPHEMEALQRLLSHDHK